jgi:hypothetical protein
MIFAGVANHLSGRRLRSGELAEHFFDDLLAVAEELVQFRVDDQGVDQVAEKPKRYGVMHLVRHLYPSSYFPEMMLVMLRG